MQNPGAGWEVHRSRWWVVPSFASDLVVIVSLEMSAGLLELPNHLCDLERALIPTDVGSGLEIVEG